MSALSTNSQRRLSKTELWRIYWDLNEMKGNVLLMHYGASSVHWERNLLEYVSKAHEAGGDVNWNADNIIYH